jgi:hypothetical protein
VGRLVLQAPRVEGQLRLILSGDVRGSWDHRRRLGDQPPYLMRAAADFFASVTKPLSASISFHFFFSPRPTRRRMQMACKCALIEFGEQRTKGPISAWLLPLAAQYRMPALRVVSRSSCRMRAISAVSDSRGRSAFPGFAEISEGALPGTGAGDVAIKMR